MATERTETVVIGGGQAGLAMGHYLAELDRPFLILEGNQRVGDSWRHRWDSLRLFTPARYDGLPGKPFPAPPWSFPTHDEFADYLEHYALESALPVRTSAPVQRLSREGSTYVVESDGQRIEADRVVVASGFDRIPKIPAFAGELDPGITHIHALDYRNPDQVAAGHVLVVGAGNSGADIALELAASHTTLLSGRHPGEIPWRIESRAAHPLDRIVFYAFSHVLTVGTPMGRRMRPQALAHSGPLIRVKSRDLKSAGVQRVPRTTGVRNGMPLLEDGRTPEVSTVIWATGFRPDYSWMDLPGFDHDSATLHQRGVSRTQPGLYFLGQLFQYALSSSMIHGVGADARYIADHIAKGLPNPEEEHTQTGIQVATP